MFFKKILLLHEIEQVLTLYISMDQMKYIATIKKQFLFNPKIL
jgi:hypothetical protein